MSYIMGHKNAPIWGSWKESIMHSLSPLVILQSSLFSNVFSNNYYIFLFNCILLKFLTDTSCYIWSSSSNTLHVINCTSFHGDIFILKHLYSVLFLQGEANKISKCENHNIYIMQEHFYTKFPTFIYHICPYESV